MIQDHTQYLLNKDLQHDSFKTSGMRRTSSRRSISLHPGQDGRCTVVIENSKSQNVQIFGYVYQNTNGQNRCPAWKTWSFFLSEICTVILWRDYYRKGNSGKISKLGMLICKPRKRTGPFLSVHVDNIKLAGKKQNIDPMWKVLVKEVDLGEPTSFLDHVYLGCTQRECETSNEIVDSYRNMSEYRISAGAKEKLP